MSKEPRSFTVDEDVNRELKQRPEINASAVVNQFLRDYLETTEGNEAEAMVRAKKRNIRELDNQIEELESKRQQEVKELNEWKEKLRTREDRLEQEAMEIVEGAPADPANARVQAAAGKLGITAEELAEQIADERGNNYRYK